MKATLVIDMPTIPEFRKKVISEICDNRQTLTVAGLSAFDLFDNPSLDLPNSAEDIAFIIVDDVDFSITSTKSSIMQLVRAPRLTVHKPAHEGCFSIQPGLVFVSRQPLDDVLKAVGDFCDVKALFERLVIAQEIKVPRMAVNRNRMATDLFKEWLNHLETLTPNGKRTESPRPSFATAGIPIDEIFEPNWPKSKASDQSSKPVHTPFNFAINNLDKSYEDLKDLIKKLWPVDDKISHSLIVLDALSDLVKEAAASMRLIDNQTKIPTNGNLAGI